jgi:hypothetical protein
MSILVSLIRQKSSSQEQHVYAQHDRARQCKQCERPKRFDTTAALYRLSPEE